jgi:nitrate/nitrite transporter NarK
MVMAEGDVEEADRLARVRSWMVGLLAIVFVMAAFADTPVSYDPFRRLFWAVLALVMLANTTGIGRGGFLHRRTVRRLLEDETTREHRRTAHIAGFWAATASALILWLLGDRWPLDVPGAMQIVVTAGTCAALLSFAVQEWIATRNA